MRTADKVKARLEAYARDPGYQAERLSILLTEEIVRLMESEGVSRSELAARMGVSKALISRLLGGAPNMTLRTLASIAVALESEVTIKLREWKEAAFVSGKARSTTANAKFAYGLAHTTTSGNATGPRAQIRVVSSEEDGRESRTAA